MFVKHYGIYLAFAPTVDLRHEGLGRYLAAFLKGAAGRTDVRFLLVCPSWSRKDLELLFASEGVPKDLFEIFSPDKKPLILRGYEAILPKRKLAKNAGRFRRWVKGPVRAAIGALMKRTLRRLVQVRSLFSLVLLLLDPGFWLGLVVLMLAPLASVVLAIKNIYQVVVRIKGRLFGRFLPIHNRLKDILGEPKQSKFVFQLYKKMEADESQHLLGLIDKLSHVCAWYCPTAFWPAFNAIRGPKLMCVPDVVLADFSVGFSGLGGDRFLTNFEEVEAAIHGGQHFVTYSEAVKWDTLVDRYAARAANVAVVHHAPNDLSRWVEINGFDEVAATSHNYYEGLLRSSLLKSSNPDYSAGFLNGAVKFLFYASQFRPNKNVLSLLKAYEYLLRRRLIGYKLILTGSPMRFPAVQKFITEHHLENDVLCLHGLKIEELAACYKLAELAVNPSLSEGGCPFTFTEALSVNTPVVMARIPVTEEVLTDPELQEMTFFDPYDWQDMARRIEWALAHRDQLLTVQRKTYAQLAQRTWTDVVNEHLEVLDRIADADGHAEAQKAA